MEGAIPEPFDVVYKNVGISHAEENCALSLVEIKRPAFQPQRTEPCFCGSGRRFKACCGSVAEPRQPPFGVHLVRDFLPADTCSQWVAYLEKQSRHPLGVHKLDERESAGLARERIGGRITDRVDLGELARPLVAKVQEAFEVSIAQEMKRRVEWFEHPQVLRYEKGGTYGPHADSDHFLADEGMWKKVIDRDVSLLLYLNEDFEGGELVFLHFNFTYRPKRGDLLFFPSSGVYAHQAMPVKNGIRYVIVSWAAYRNEPRVLDMRPEDCIEIKA